MRARNNRVVKLLHRRVLSWYRKHQRDFLWRTTNDPYVIAASEVMLQQTQAARVEQKLPLFLKKFPTLQSLAWASKADVIRTWQGMGYNNRAIRLQEFARTIVDEFHGAIPSDVEVLQRLPGVGPYTAHAIACFAFRRRVPVVDVNVQRVISRVFGRMRSASEALDEKTVWKMADKILSRDAYTWNQALMELGATICTARKPECSRCPISNICHSRRFTETKRWGVLSKKQSEPTYAGLPHRLWRGKIVQALRMLDDYHAISLLKLGRSIKKDFHQDELLWLAGLISKLEKDRILQRRGIFVTLARE